jgi:hypothetical protein
MDELFYYLQESDKAIVTINASRQKAITEIEFQIALGKALGYDEKTSHHIIVHKLSSEQMLALLENEDFEQPEIIAEITFEKSILPEEMPIRLDEERIRTNGEVWKINKNDKDPFPSNPHAHNLQTGHKVHLGDGSLYNFKNKPLGKAISKKDLIALRSKVKNITLPPLTR